MVQMSSGVDRVQAAGSVATMVGVYTSHEFVTRETTVVITAMSSVACERVVVRVGRTASVAQTTIACPNTGCVTGTTAARTGLTRKVVYVMESVLKYLKMKPLKMMVASKTKMLKQTH